jgi:hypothetical protein
MSTPGRSKKLHPRPAPRAYRRAFERLDAALAENSGSAAMERANERADRARRALAGGLSEEPESTEQNQN